MSYEKRNPNEATGGVNPKVRYCLINNINSDYREPLEVHTDDQGRYILVPEPPINTPEELLHREFVGYFGIQGLYDQTQNKITLTRPMLEPTPSGTKYYLTEQVNGAQNTILEPIGLIAVYGLKSVLGYYFRIPEITGVGDYYAEYLGHTGYSYSGGRYGTESNVAHQIHSRDKLSYNEELGAVCEIPPTIDEWVSLYFESANVTDPTLPNTGTDLLPFYGCSQYHNEDNYLKLFIKNGDSSITKQLYDYFSSPFFASTLSLTNITDMRLRITVTEMVGHGDSKITVTLLYGLVINGMEYAFHNQQTFQLGTTPTVALLINYNAEYTVYDNLDVWPFE